jgi:predicted TPR repeat methyltransferase
MTLNQLSSGDLIADRRAEYAHMLADSGDHADAADLMIQALELVPDWAAGWFRLADYEEKSGRKEAAVAALRKVLTLNPDDIFGASLKLALLGGAETPDQPSSLYVAQLFDDYADRFDKALVEKLDYTVPEKLAALIAEHAGDARFADVIDLGCGTGLLGPEIRAMADRLEGFDLSQNMLAKAEEKQASTIILPRPICRLRRKRPGCFRMAAAPRRSRHRRRRLMYLGNLESVFASIVSPCAQAPISPFPSRRQATARRFTSRPSLRYAHSEAYVRALCKRHGLEVGMRQAIHHSQRWRKHHIRHSVPCTQGRLKDQFLRSFNRSVVLTYSA